MRGKLLCLMCVVSGKVGSDHTLILKVILWTVVPWVDVSTPLCQGSPQDVPDHVRGNLGELCCRCY